MAKEWHFPATVTISEEDLIAALQSFKAIQDMGQGEPPTEELKKKRGRPRKVEPAPEIDPDAALKESVATTRRGAVVENPEAPEEEIRLRIDSRLPIEEQVKGVIVQVVAQKYGDAIARKIFVSWGPEDAKAVIFCHNLWKGVTLEVLAKAVSDFPATELGKPPRLFMSGLFQSAVNLIPEAQPVMVPKAPEVNPLACTICERVGGHGPGCPNGMRRPVEADGGAIPSRVPQAEPPRGAPAAAEPCNVGGPQGGCPIPMHTTVYQGGTHVFVHPPEVMESLRRATGPSTVQPAWSAPQPPAPPPTPKAPRKAPAKRGGRKK